MTLLTTQAAMTTSQMAVATPRRELRLTVVFHPNQSRVGAYAILCTRKVNEPYSIPALTLGRHHPVFSDGEAISDGTVNRQAITLNDTPNGLDIGATKSESRVKIGPNRTSHACLSSNELTAGVAIQLGNAVVLLLREVTVFESSHTDAIAASLFPGCAPETVRLRHLIAAVAGTQRAVLLLGETGTGKRMAAKAIHAASTRRDQSLEVINVAGLDPTLAALELFGAYDEAGQKLVRKGVFHRADGGTLLLEQIDYASPIVQILLMQAVTGEIQPIGGSMQQLDVRILSSSRIALSNNLQFNGALAHRLAGFELHLAPLRLRKEDIGPAFFKAAQHIETQHLNYPSKDIVHNSATARHWADVVFSLLSIPWPGNYRELDNYLFSALSGYLDTSLTPTVTALEHFRERIVKPPGQKSETTTTPTDNVIRIK